MELDLFLHLKKNILNLTVPIYNHSRRTRFIKYNSRLPGYTLIQKQRGIEIKTRQHSVFRWNNHVIATIIKHL